MSLSFVPPGRERVHRPAGAGPHDEVQRGARVRDGDRGGATRKYKCGTVQCSAVQCIL